MRETLPLEAEFEALQQEHPLLLWAAAIAMLAAVVRLALLDRAPLAPAEAQTAWSALLAARGWLADAANTPAPAVSPLLANAMSLAFFLFGTSDTAARLFPALAGIGCAMLPLLLVPVIGWRSSIAAAVLLALSPMLVEASREVNAAIISTALALAIVVCSIRLAFDRPRWAPWGLAIAVGLALGADSSVVVALFAAGIAAVATWNVVPDDARAWLGSLRASDLRWPIVAGILVYLVAVSGALMNLSGIGWSIGGLWAGIGEVLHPAPFPTRNLAAVLAYEAPIIPIAIVGFIVEQRAGNRLALFLGQWLVLLLALAAVTGQHVLALAALPVLPVALLAALAVRHLPTDRTAYRLGGQAWSALALTLGVAIAAWMILATTIGGGRDAAPFTFIALLGLVLLTLSVWVRDVPQTERWPAIAMASTVVVLAFSVGSIGRLSFGGSPPGMEILRTEETAPQLRDAFAQLSVLASTDGRGVLSVSPSTPIVALWYGRDIKQQQVALGIPPAAITLREASASSDRGRTPFETISQLNRADISALNILRWMVGRSALLAPQNRDIIITR